MSWEEELEGLDQVTVPSLEQVLWQVTMQCIVAWNKGRLQRIQLPADSHHRSIPSHPKLLGPNSSKEMFGVRVTPTPGATPEHLVEEVVLVVREVVEDGLTGSGTSSTESTYLRPLPGIYAPPQSFIWSLSVGSPARSIHPSLTSARGGCKILVSLEYGRKDLHVEDEESLLILRINQTQYLVSAARYSNV